MGIAGVQTNNTADAVTIGGMPFVFLSNCDSVAQSWINLRDDLNEPGKGLGGFYVLRHLRATEFGSRAGCSIGEMKRWLGHAASSQVADVYMKPVSPENRPVVDWVRTSLRAARERRTSCIATIISGGGGNRMRKRFFITMLAAITCN